MNDPKVAEILSRHGLSTAKSLGQNFLKSGAILESIADAALPEGADAILEIGAGIGSLTALLCARSRRVITVEIDRKLEPLLAEQLPFPHHSFLWEDILKCDLPQIHREHFGGQPMAIVGNLPYYITTDILMLLLEHCSLWSSAILMVQREVAERLLADAGSKEYRAASVITQALCEGELLLEVPPHHFYPPPHVHSAVIRLRPRKDRPQEKGFIAFAKAAFAARRKMLCGSAAMQQLLHTDKAGIAALLQEAGLPPDSRAERFSPEDFCRLYKLAQKS